VSQMFIVGPSVCVIRLWVIFYLLSASRIMKVWWRVPTCRSQAITIL